jgi:dTDP-4-amino-4,6-dideoxygalactose transaminase
MQLIDLKSQYQRIEDDITTRIKQVLDSQIYIMGPEVLELESKLESYTKTKHVITCSSGTDALVMALMAIELQPNEAVFVPSFSFFASAECISLVGGKPVFVDVNYADFNISTNDLETAINLTLQKGELIPKAIIAVDLFGQPADYNELHRIADDHGLVLIEDAAQSFGSHYHQRLAGSLGKLAATSFYPAKPLGCYGDGGAVFTDDDNLAVVLESIRIHGQGVDKYDNVRIGLNGRLDTLQAAVLLAKLKIFASEIEARNQIASYYSEMLSDVLVIPSIHDDRSSVWAQYTLLAKDSSERMRILAALCDNDIPYAIFYPTPIHKSTAYSNINGLVDRALPVSEDLSGRVFSIPMHAYLSQTDIERIAQVIRSVINK